MQNEKSVRRLEVQSSALFSLTVFSLLLAAGCQIEKAPDALPLDDRTASSSRSSSEAEAKPAFEEGTIIIPAEEDLGSPAALDEIENDLDLLVIE